MTVITFHVKNVIVCIIFMRYYMERYALNDLIKWKDSKNRKPLILHGARQVGKT